MRIFLTPVYVSRIDPGKELDLVILHRRGDEPRLFMHDIKSEIIENRAYPERSGIYVYGRFVDGQSFQDLQEDDTLFITMKPSYSKYKMHAGYADLFPNGSTLFPFKCNNTPFAIAAAMESSIPVFLTESEMEPIVSLAMKLKEQAHNFYQDKPSLQHIMLKDGNNINAVSLLELMSMQEPGIHDTLQAMFLSYSPGFTSFQSTEVETISERILDHCKVEEAFALMTQEEQVEKFIEFSKIVSTTKKEYVPDSLISQIEHSPEYQDVKEKLEGNGLGISQTQQFNVLQQVGYFSNSCDWCDSIIYNLSDMGAGKTLMTVEAIYLLDLKQISTWEKEKEKLPEDFDYIDYVVLPDKHIIAPTLSVKSSWVDTFRLFYDVEEVSDMEYRLSTTYNGITAASTVYVSSFTVKDGKVFVKEKLPEANPNTYLIIDEIHQLVSRNIAKTKFFPPNTTPISIYNIFVLSGTMSNMKTMQWYNFKRFMGFNMMEKSVAALQNELDETCERNRTNITQSARNIRTNQHRYFDTENITEDNYYRHTNEKKQTVVEKDFFLRYGSQIIYPYRNGVSVESLLTNKNFKLLVDPVEVDNINFELFYDIVGPRAVTAQSQVVAEELFGHQKKQHVSDIIKTVSPLSKSDIQILKTLHHIAGDYMIYKSQPIAKAINNAILNLNDGLQTKNIYDIVSKFAEKNMRFLQYLSTLDVDILKQLPKSGLIQMPKLEETDKYKVLTDILSREPDETHLIVVNDYYALKTLSDALGIEHLTKTQLRQELDYQEILDGLFEKQSVVIVTQDMIKSSLDLVQANRLIQYQLNTEISDIIQTQNRINRIGQTRETRGYYIASDQLQENLIELFLESYRNIRVAHKGIVELFTDITSQINIINDYLERAIGAIENGMEEDPPELEETPAEGTKEQETGHLAYRNRLPKGDRMVYTDGIAQAILFPKESEVIVLVPLKSGQAFPLGRLKDDVAKRLNVLRPKKVSWDIWKNRVVEDKAE